MFVLCVRNWERGRLGVIYLPERTDSWQGDGHKWQDINFLCETAKLPHNIR